MLEKAFIVYRIIIPELEGYDCEVYTDISSLQFSSRLWSDNPFVDLIEDYKVEGATVEFKIALEKEEKAVKWLNNWFKSKGIK